jgi:hypothetical protein
MEILAWTREFGPDITAFAGSAAMIGLYYVFLGYRVRRNPTYTIHGVNEVARTLWVASVMNNPSRDVMAVQTLRNFIMGSSLMASTATLLIIGTLTLSGQAENISRSWHALNVVGSHSAELWIIKVMVLLLDFIVAFFAFALPVRGRHARIFLCRPARVLAVRSAIPGCVHRGSGHHPLLSGPLPADGRHPIAGSAAGVQASQ